MHRFVTAILLAAFAAGGLAATAQGGNQTAYDLGPQDKLRIRVYEWRSAKGEVFEWTALNGEFAVDAAGRVSLPLLGAVTAAGKPIAAFAATVSQLLQAKIGLVEAPEVAVDISQFRPFYILGRVERPGEYAFRPDLTVLQATSLAGGFYRPPPIDRLRTEREEIASRGDLRVLSLERAGFLARVARLTAEVQGKENVSFPEELTREDALPIAAQVMREELSLFRSRRVALSAQTETLVQGKALLSRELDSLNSKGESQDRQVRLARDEVERVTSLASKGLVVSARKLGAEQNAAQLESSKIDIQVAASRARQESSRIDRTLIELRSKRQNDAIVELRDSQSRLAELSEREETVRRLTQESKERASARTEAVGNELDDAIFVLTRGAGADATTVTVGPSDLLRPGDVLNVRSAEVAAARAPFVDRAGRAPATRAAGTGAAAPPAR